jgi:iron complex outermembrane receptor protein
MNKDRFAKKPIRAAITALAASGLSLSAGSAYPEGAVLEEVLVTATRREESLQDVAIPMTAVSGDALERAFAQDLRDLTAAAPNVSLEPIGIFQNSASFFIRGQGALDIESASDSKVAILVDGVVQGRVSTALGDFVDVQSVEILRGPQGTLFGRNTIAGAVQILNNKPQFDEFSVGGAVQAGDFGRLDVKGVVNIPIADERVAARIAAKSTNHDGYWKNSYVDKDRGATERLTILPSLRFAPNENTDIVLRGEYNRTRDDTYMNQSHHYCREDPVNLWTTLQQGFFPDNDLVISTQTLFNAFVLQQDPITAAANAAAQCGRPIEDVSVDDEYTAINSEDRGQGADLDIWGITAEVNYDIPDVGRITYIGNYREVEEDIIFTIDAAPHDLFAGRRFQEHDQMSHELRFASSFSDTFDFVAGAYYFEQEYTMLQESFGILFAPNILLGPFTPNDLTFTSPATFGQGGWSNQKNDAWALFAQANYHFNEQLTLTVGGRYTDETKNFSHCGVGAGDPTAPFSGKTQGCNNVPLYVVDPTVLNFDYLTPLFGLNPAIGFDASGGAEAGCLPVLDPTGSPITCNNRLKGKETWTEFTPMAGISYQINDDVMAFFTWTQGFKSGGFNGRATTPSTIGPYDPETADNFEIGIKSDWLDNRLRVNLNAFYTDIKDFQQAFIRPSEGAGGQETVQSNLGSVETKGFELEIQAVPTEQLSLWGAVGYLDTKQKGFCTDGDGFSGTDPDNAPPPGPFSGDLEQCAPAEKIVNEIGQFLGWLVPTDNSNLLPGPRAPKWTVSAGFAYEFNLDQLGSLTLSGDWLFRTKQIVSASRATELDGVQQFNGDFLSHYRDDSHIVNASLIWRDQTRKYRVSAFVKNLTNELHNQATTNEGGVVEFRAPNLRRHWGIEVAYNM